MWFFKRDTLPKPRFQPSPSQAHINDQTAFSVLSPLLPKCLILIIYKRSAWSASVITAAWEGDVDVAFHDTWRDAALSKSQPSWSCTRLTVTPFRLEYRIPFSTAWLSEIHPAILHNLISILNRCDFLFGRKKLIPLQKYSRLAWQQFLYWWNHTSPLLLLIVTYLVLCKL